MSDRSRIEWTDATWNPATGCSPVSAGCDHCYARRLAERFRGVPGHAFERGFDVQVRPERLNLPARWRCPRRIFVNSMGDLFHYGVPLEFIQSVFSVMQACPWHTFQVLTKRPTSALALAGGLPWPANVWMGVSIENADTLERLDDLRCIPALHRFVSFEPLLGPIGSPTLAGIHWVIAGGETGPGARPILPPWICEVRDLCRAQQVPFFFKGWGAARPGDHSLDGRLWLEIPA